MSCVKCALYVGLYCKWLISGEQGKELTVDLLNLNIIPTSEDCGYDGLVIYEGNTTKARKHGESRLTKLESLYATKTMM